jgi:hypothetical protein
MEINSQKNDIKEKDGLFLKLNDGITELMTVNCEEISNLKNLLKDQEATHYNEIEEYNIEINI